VLAGGKSRAKLDQPQREIGAAVSDGRRPVAAPVDEETIVTGQIPPSQIPGGMGAPRLRGRLCEHRRRGAVRYGGDPEGAVLLVERQRQLERDLETRRERHRPSVSGTDRVGCRRACLSQLPVKQGEGAAQR
jgi:hypothetical protein